MFDLYNSRNYIIIKDKIELKQAQFVELCRYIILEDNNVIYIWEKEASKWVKYRYVMFGSSKEKDDEITGNLAYMSFYNYCGRSEIERMKNILSPIPIWESYEQMHYANIDFLGQKLYQNIYEFDANSAFTYGVMQLPQGFEPLKDYMQELFDKKQEATNPIIRSKYKNLQNYLIGYFARIKAFIRVRSDIIMRSNENIMLRMSEIANKKGNVYLSNTDSIVTDDIGAEVMQKYIGDKVGQFKLSKKADRLCYKSPNAYQIGDKLVYSGVKYFARINTDFFEDKYARQEGNLIEGFDFQLEAEDEMSIRLCRCRYGQIDVYVANPLGELLDVITYKIS